MSKLIRVVFQPDGRVARVETGATVMSAAHRLGLHINAPCGGRGVCGNCRVEIPRDAPPPTPAEREHFTGAELAAGWRLACQAKLLRDTVVAVPEATGASDQKILTAGIEHPVTLRPNVRKRHLAVPAPTLDDGRADADRLMEACRAADPRLNGRLAAALVSRLPRLLREAHFDVTAVLVGDDLTWVEPADTAARCCGVAADLGTTTVVGTLFDLRTGGQLAVASRTNPQTALGDDVVSRIHHAATARGGLRHLQRRAVQCLNEIVGELCRRTRVRRTDIYEMTVAGNTTMNHLLLGVDPSHLAQAPYVAALRAGFSAPAAEVGLRLSPGAALYTLPNIAGFVGGDTVGVILATDLRRVPEAAGKVPRRLSPRGEGGVRGRLPRTQEVSPSPSPLPGRERATGVAGARLAVDIGTNGEMVLATAEGLIACSTAAGPAFEGARISHGMRASAGAIEGVHFDGDDLTLSTIDNEPPRGLCGTGLIEAVSSLLALGVIDQTGRIVAREDLSGVPRRVAERVVPGELGGHVVLAHAEVAGVPYDVALTQRDVREVQLAKAAIAAGIHTLLAERGRPAAGLDEVLLAGAFGNHICVDCAVRIGLLPALPRERITFVGNAAAEGARMVLLDRTLREEAERISREVRYLELAGRSDFQAAFSEAMLFPA